VKIPYEQKKRSQRYLNLEATTLSASTSLLELASLGAYEGLGVASGRSGNTKVFHSLASVPGATEENAVGSLGLNQSELIKGEALTASSYNASASSLGEAECADAHLGEFMDTYVIGDGSYENSDLAFATGFHELSKAADGQRGPVGLAHKQTLENNLVKLSAGTASEEGVQLYQEGKVYILRCSLGALLVANAATAGYDINTL